MTARAPDKNRRLIPRWRSASDALLMGELKSPVERSRPAPTISSPTLDELLEAWSTNRSVELAAEIVSFAAVTGQRSSAEQAAAYLLDENTDASPTIRSLAERLLNPVQAEPPAHSNELESDSEIYRTIANLKHRLKRYPRNAITWLDLARHHTMLGQVKQALEHVQIATNLAPSNRFILRGSARFFTHIDETEQGLRLLHRCAGTRDDPWLLAAELSLSSIAGRTSRFAKMAVRLAEKDEWSPWDSSELNGAVATLLSQSGSARKAHKLFRQSVRNPTENALAQAQWAAIEGVGPLISSQMLKQRSAHEAQALRARVEMRWRDALEQCRLWTAMDPTSSRPLTLGSFVALTALEDGEVGLQFTSRAAKLSPDPMSYNNLAVAHAYLGNVIEASRILSRVDESSIEEDSKPTYRATQGLIEFRRGNLERGRQLYLEAAQMEPCRRDPNYRALVLWHLLREEANAGTEGLGPVVDTLWKSRKHIPRPIVEFEALYKNIIKKLKENQGRRANETRRVPMIVVENIERDSKQ